MTTPQKGYRCLIQWRLYLSGFRSVSLNATDKPLRLKIQFMSRDLVPSDRATCTIASRVNFFGTRPSGDRDVDSQGFHNISKSPDTYKLNRHRSQRNQYFKTCVYQESWLSMHSNLYDHFHYVFFAIREGLGERHDNLKATQHCQWFSPTKFLCKQSEGGCTAVCPYLFQDLLAWNLGYRCQWRTESPLRLLSYIILSTELSLDPCTTLFPTLRVRV